MTLHLHGTQSGELCSKVQNIAVSLFHGLTFPSHCEFIFGAYITKLLLLPIY